MSVTIVIPTLNSCNTLEKCIKSIKSQSLKPDELIIVDGGSADKTINICKKYNVVFFKCTKGLAAQSNLGIVKSKGEFIAFLDSDCIAEKYWLETLYNSIKSKNIIAVGGRLKETFTEGLSDKWRTQHMNQDWGAKKRIDIPFLFGCNFLCKKWIFNYIGKFCVKYDSNYEDVDFFKRIKDRKLKIMYNPHAECYHLKKDSLNSVMATNYKWQYHAYPLPKNVRNLLLRLTIYNPYKTFRYLIKDILSYNLSLLLYDFFMYFYHCFYDIKKYLFSLSH